MKPQPDDHVCPWCGNRFTPRRDGGKPQVFCRPACRRDVDRAGRRWLADAIATGAVSIDALRKASVTTRALLRAAVPPALVVRYPAASRACGAPRGE